LLILFLEARYCFEAVTSSGLILGGILDKDCREGEVFTRRVLSARGVKTVKIVKSGGKGKRDRRRRTVWILKLER
jgi:hypothetical protein